MDKIFKYQLQVEDVQDVEMPIGSTVLTVQAQGPIPCIWAHVSPEARIVKRRFRTYGTGHPMKDSDSFPFYVGTYQLSGGALVFHVFTDRVEYT